jgi:hypothetical protein
MAFKRYDVYFNFGGDRRVVTDVIATSADSARVLYEDHVHRSDFVGEATRSEKEHCMIMGPATREEYEEFLGASSRLRSKA